MRSPMIQRALTAALVMTFAALTPLGMTRAQEATKITVDGSQIVSPVLNKAASAYQAVDSKVTVDVQVSGTGGGFEKLCGGTLDINMAARAITDAEIAACQAKGVNFVELQLGYDAMVIVVNSGSKAQCLAADAVNKLLGPSATGVSNWQTVDPSIGDAAINPIFITTKSDDATSAIRTLVDSVVAGDGLRSDFQIAENSDLLVESVGRGLDAVGIITLKQYNDSNKQGIKALQLRNGTSCIDATVPNLDEGRYFAGQSLFVYLNAASLDRAEVKGFASYLLGSAGQRTVRDSGFVTGSITTYDRGLSYINNKTTGRTFSRIQSVQIPAETAGTVTIDGSPALYSVLQQVNAGFIPRFTGIKVAATTFGDVAGFRKLCTNGADLIAAVRQPTDAENQACQTVGVQKLELSIGARGVVVVVNSANSFALCLKSAEIVKLFGAEAKSKTWKDVNESFPATPLLLTVPVAGAAETDLLLKAAQPDAIAPFRRSVDVTENGDPLYRAAATKNTEGAVTYMTYTQYLDAQQQHPAIKAVALDTGAGCVEPTVETIKAGKYGVAQSLYLYFNVNSFSRADYRAYVWYLLSDDALTSFGKAGIVGLDNAAFIAARDVVLDQFNKVTAPVAVATPEATAQATAQATVEATVQATAEATPAK